MLQGSLTCSGRAADGLTVRSPEASCRLLVWAGNVLPDRTSETCRSRVSGLSRGCRFTGRSLWHTCRHHEALMRIRPIWTLHPAALCREAGSRGLVGSRKGLGPASAVRRLSLQWAAHCGRLTSRRSMQLRLGMAANALAFCQPLFRLHHTTRLPTTRKWPRTERVHRPHTICFEASILLQRPSFGAGSVSTSQGGKFWRKCFPSGIRQPSPRRDTPRASWR